MLGVFHFISIGLLSGVLNESGGSNCSLRGTLLESDDEYIRIRVHPLHKLAFF